MATFILLVSLLFAVAIRQASSQEALPVFIDSFTPIITLFPLATCLSVLSEMPAEVPKPQPSPKRRFSFKKLLGGLKMLALD